MENQLSPEFLNGGQQRLACMLLLDTSSSMAGERIEALNSGMRTLLEAVRKDELARMRVDLAVMTFDDSVELVHDFLCVDQWTEVPHLEANGVTCMGAALMEGVRRIAERKKQYKANGVAYYRPWLFLVTDGEATDSTDEASDMLRDALSKKQLTVFPVGVGSGVDLDKLRRITHTPVAGLNEAQWDEMFVWLSGSVSSISRSQPGEQIELPSPQWITKVTA